MAPAPPGGLAPGLSDFGLSGFGLPGLRRGAELREPLPLCPTGVSEVDSLLGGGFSRGRLSEITGPPSSGRTSLALALLARTTGAGQLVAVVDLADAFDPPSAEACGVQLTSVLWVRARAWRSALRCTQRLLETDGIPLVLLDLPASGALAHDNTTWLRLSRLAAGTRTALVVLSGQRCTSSHSEVVLEMQPDPARFVGSPALLEEIETRAVLVRHRTRPSSRAAPLLLRTSVA